MKRLYIISLVAVLLISSAMIPSPVSAQAPTEVWVDDNWAGLSDGTVVDGHTIGTDAFAAIQDGIDAVVSGGTVNVAEGTYENITVPSGKDVIVEGDGALTTTIDGGGSGSVIWADAVGPNTRIEGFTITNGNGSPGGGGIYINACSPTITSCIITNNSAPVAAGILVNFSSSQPVISNCLIKDNTASSSGGGIYVANSAKPTILNCTIVNNTAGNGGGIYDASSSSYITNTIIYDNSSGNLTVGGTTNDRVNYSCIGGGWSEGTGNTGDDPLFVGSGNYRLQAGSSCIDAGDPAFAGPPELDLDGNLRIHDGDGNGSEIVDIGVYEYGSSQPTPEYTLTISVDPSGAGSVNADPAGPYSYDDVVELTAVPSFGYVFDHWGGDLTGSDNPASITMDGDKSVTAYFAPSEYTLTIGVDPSGGGTVSADPAEPYHFNDVVELTAVPGAGYYFDHWDGGGDLSGSDNPASITMSGDKNVTAYFTPYEYTLTTTVDPSGGGTVNADPAGPYHYDDIVQLTAVPGAGYVFDHWEGDVTGSDNPAFLTIDGNKSVTAYFTPSDYTLTTTVDPSGGGTVNADPAGPYSYDDVVELTAVPGAGYVFDHWEGDVTGSDNPAFLTIDGNKSVTAYFTLPEYTLTTSVDPSGSGSVNVNPAGPYNHNDVVELTAVPSFGYEFDHWGGDLTGSDNPAPITMDGNKSVTAYFAPSEYTLTISVDPSGSGSVSADPAEPYYFNDVVELTAVPVFDYYFDHWGGDLSGSDNPASITMSGDKNVTAYFALNEYTLTTSVDPSGGGTVSADPAGPYYYDDIVQVTAVPNVGYYFDHWEGDLSGSDNPASISMSGDKSVTAYFTPFEYTITTSVDPSGGGTVEADPAGPYYYNDVVQVTAVPGAGYVFDHWGGDLSGSDNPASITMDGDKSVTAYFTLSEYTITTSVDPSGGGTVSTNPAGPYHYDDIVQVIAVPGAGYIFDHWEGDLTGSDNPASLTMNGDKNVTAYFTEIPSAYDIKSDAINKLEDAKGEDRFTNRRIDRIIWFIRASLNSNYWEDNVARLDARHGNRVFNWEMAAAMSLKGQIKMFERQIPILERMIEWKEKKGRSTDREEASLAAIQAALPVFQEVLGDLAEADRVLAEVAIEDARNTPVQNPRFESFHNRYIAKAEQALDRAMQLIDDRPERAILYFEKAWQYAQRAIRFASRS